MRNDIRRAFQDKGRAFEHIFTYAANPLSTAAALAVMDILVKEDLVRHAAVMGDLLFEKAQGLREHGMVGDIRGKGLLMGVELVQEQETRTPFPSELKVGKRLASMALDRGLVIYPGSGCVDGIRGDHFLICPPLIIDGGGCGKIIGMLDECLGELEREIHQPVP